MYVGNALFAYAGSLAFGLSWVVMQDRGQFQMARFAVTSLSVLAALAACERLARRRGMLDVPTEW